MQSSRIPDVQGRARCRLPLSLALPVNPPIHQPHILHKQKILEITTLQVSTQHAYRILPHARYRDISLNYTHLTFVRLTKKCISHSQRLPNRQPCKQSCLNVERLGTEIYVLCSDTRRKHSVDNVYFLHHHNHYSHLDSLQDWYSLLTSHHVSSKKSHIEMTSRIR